MNYRQIAEKIPAEYRKEILELNLVHNAIAVSTDPSMDYLVKMWQTYVEPTFKGDCDRCLATVLKNYKSLVDDFIKLEKEEKFLTADDNDS